jgi:hypothetical protein
MPYDKAIRVPAIAICLRNLAAAETRQKIKGRRIRLTASTTIKRSPSGSS